MVSDKQGNVYTVLKEAAKKPVTAVIAMEILLHTYLNQVGLAAHHIKRDYNQWADELTHPNFSQFSASKKLDGRRLMEGFRLMPILTRNFCDFTHALRGADGEAGRANMPQSRTDLKTLSPASRTLRRPRTGGSIAGAQILGPELAWANHIVRV